MRRWRPWILVLLFSLLCAGCLGSGGLRVNDVCIRDPDPFSASNLYIVTDITNESCTAYVVTLDWTGAMMRGDRAVELTGKYGTLTKIGEYRNDRIYITNRQAYQDKVDKADPSLRILNGTYPVFE